MLFKKLTREPNFTNVTFNCRLFIQAAAKGEILPDFPLATHCSSLGTPPLTINHILVNRKVVEEKKTIVQRMLDFKLYDQ